MKRFLIFLGILFSSVFITGRVSAMTADEANDENYLYEFVYTIKQNNSDVDWNTYNKYFIHTYYQSYNNSYQYYAVFYANDSDISLYVPDYDLNAINISCDNCYVINNSYSLDFYEGSAYSYKGSEHDPIKYLLTNDLYLNNELYLEKNVKVSEDKEFTINFHLNGGIAVDSYQSDIELQNIKNEMINSWTLYDTYKDKKSIMNDFNNLFLSPNLNDFTKFSNRYVTISNVSELKQIYMKVINKEYAQPIYYYEDFTINIKSNELEERLKKITITKENMSFKGLYYDANYQNNVKENYIISSDVDLYAKYDYENVDDFLKDNTFKSYTFDENYAYAFISIGKNVGQDVYLGLDFLNYSIEIYKYDKTELKANKGSSFCLTPYFSKDNKYYYRLETINNDYYNVLVIPREKLITEENGIFTTHYNFLLTDNATVTYTNDLKQAEIVDDAGNKITIDIEDSYNYSQEAFLKDTDDLLTIFKNLLKNKDNNVFQYFEQVWQFLKRSKIFIYLNILIIGALIILIIKAANRR